MTYLINACPNLTVLKIESMFDNGMYLFLQQIISKLKKLETLFIEHGYCDEPVSINHLASKMCQNLRHLKQIYLPALTLSDYNVRLMSRNIPSLRLVRVHNRLFISDGVSQSELNICEGYNFFR